MFVRFLFTSESQAIAITRKAYVREFEILFWKFTWIADLGVRICSFIIFCSVKPDEANVHLPFFFPISVKTDHVVNLGPVVIWLGFCLWTYQRFTLSQIILSKILSQFWRCLLYFSKSNQSKLLKSGCVSSLQRQVIFFFLSLGDYWAMPF